MRQPSQVVALTPGASSTQHADSTPQHAGSTFIYAGMKSFTAILHDTESEELVEEAWWCDAGGCGARRGEGDVCVWRAVAYGEASRNTCTPSPRGLQGA